MAKRTNAKSKDKGRPLSRPGAWFRATRFRLLVFVSLGILFVVFVTWFSLKVWHGERIEATVAVIEGFDGSVYCDYEYDVEQPVIHMLWDNHVSQYPNWTLGSSRPPQPPGPRWLRYVFNDYLFTEPVSVDLFSDRVRDDDLRHLEILTSLRSLTLTGTSISDAGLSHLQGLTKLRYLDLADTQLNGPGLEYLSDMKDLEVLLMAFTAVTDADLAHIDQFPLLGMLGLGKTQITDKGLLHLTGFRQLRSLDVGETQVTDAGLVHLEDLKTLESLRLFGTEVTDAGLVHLEGLKKLKWLDLNGTAVTDEGVRKLEKALPGLEYVFAGNGVSKWPGLSFSKNSSELNGADR